jgi:hypothetical protein
VRYNAIWAKTSQQHTLYYNQTSSALGSLIAIEKSFGYEPMSINAMVLSGDQVRYNVIFTPAGKARKYAVSNQFQDLGKLNGDYYSQGFRMYDINASVRSNEIPYYNAVWMLSSQDRPAYWSWGPNDFASLNYQLKKVGYYLVKLNGFYASDQVLYNAIWETQHAFIPFVRK